MKIVIMGCGRVGAQLASLLDREGHSVTVLDTDAYSFRRLPSDFNGTALLGNGIDEGVLKRAGIEEADAFFALTQGDKLKLPSISSKCPRRSAVSMTLCDRNYIVPWD